MNLVFSVLKKLRLKAVNYCHRLFPANPYQQHLEMLITYRMVPFTSMENLFNHQIDSKRVKQIHLIMGVVFLNLFRLSVIVLNPTPFVRELLVQYFRGQANSWYFHFTLLAAFVAPSFLCKF